MQNDDMLASGDVSRRRPPRYHRRMRSGVSGAVEPYRFTVDDYYRMAEVGILPPGVRVELVAGEVVRMSPIGRKHASCVGRLQFTLTQRLGRRAAVRIQQPIRLGEFSEPEPDVVVARWREDYYAAGHPDAEDTLLVIEVGDATARYDREIKGALYATAGVPEYWVVDLDAQAVDVYRDATPEGYRTHRRAVAGESVVPAAFPDCALSVADFAVIA
jgi:Uma2 family endonuclease